MARRTLKKKMIIIIIYYSTCIFADCKELIPVNYDSYKGVTYKKNEKEKKKTNMMDVKYLLSTSLTTLLLNYKFHLEFLNLEYIARMKRARLCDILKIVMFSTYLGMFFAWRGVNVESLFVKIDPGSHLNSRCPLELQ